MTFSMMVKDELASLEYNSIESRIVLSEYLNLNSIIILFLFNFNLI